MRIALCLYGQPRNFSNNWFFIAKNLIDGNNVDIFYHTWYDKNNLGINKLTPGHENINLENDLFEKLLILDGVKKSKIEPQLSFHSDKLIPTTEENINACWPWSVGKYDRDTFLKDRVMSNYSMWYSINQSILMKELYSQENNFEYDCVVISRFDVSPKVKLDFSIFNLNNVVSGVPGLPRNEINDWFIISNNKNSNIIGSVFYTIDYHRDKIVESGGVWTNEAYLRDQLKLFNVSVDYLDLNISF